jgi:hypothetical protein
MKPFDRSIDEQKEKQDMWLLYPDGALENKMNLKIPIFQMMLFYQILCSRYLNQFPSKSQKEALTDAQKFFSFFSPSAN